MSEMGIEMEMANKIHHLRMSQRLTLEQVANEVGVGKSTVRKWETGMIANMRRDKIAALAKALHTTPEYLMGWSDNKSDRTAAPWSAKFREHLQKIVISTDSADAQEMGINLSEWEAIAYESTPLSLETCCNICDMAGESLDDMVELHDTEPNKSESRISAEAQKIAAAFDKATAKEKQMVRLALSEYLDAEEEIKPVRIAALSNDGSAIDFSGANPDAELPEGLNEGPAIP